MKKRALSIILAALMLLSCCTAGLSAFAADDAELKSIADTLYSFNKDTAETDHNYDDAINLIKDLSAEELTALGKAGGAFEGTEFWWAGNQLVHLHRLYESGSNKAANYTPSVYFDIAARVPAYADFVDVLFDGVIAYSFLIGTPTATDIPLSEAERTPLAIGKRVSALEQSQIDSLTSDFYFGSGNYLCYPGFTENLSEEKAKDENIGAVRNVIDFFGISIENWDTVYENETTMKNFRLAMQFFINTFAQAETSLAALDAFSAVIEGLHEPYRTADVETAKAAYAAVPPTAWSLADARARSARATYRKIITAAGLEDNTVDLSVYQQTDLGKNALSDKTAGQLLDLLRDTANVDEKLRSLLSSVATGQNIAALLGGLAGKNDMLGELLSFSLILQGLEKDSKFDGAAKKIRALMDKGHTESFCEYCYDEEGVKSKTWSCADQFTSADFGFADGDFYGFADALGGCLSQLSALLNLVGGFTFKNTSTGDSYTIGKYEDLIPLFELLDLPTPSSADFTKAEETLTYTDADGNVYTDPVRAGINCLLKPVADYLMNDFQAAPLDETISLLPKVAYAIESGLLNDTVQSLIGPFASFGLKVDMNKDTIWKIVESKLVNGGPAVPLTKAQFDALVTDLAGCGEPVVKKSVSIAYANRLGLNTQKNKVISVLLKLLLEMENTAEGKAFLEQELDAIGAPSLAKSLLNFAAQRGVAFTFKAVNILMPYILIILAVLSFFGKVKRLLGK